MGWAVRPAVRSHDGNETPMRRRRLVGRKGTVPPQRQCRKGQQHCIYLCSFPLEDLGVWRYGRGVGTTAEEQGVRNTRLFSAPPASSVLVYIISIPYICRCFLWLHSPPLLSLGPIRTRRTWGRLRPYKVALRPSGYLFARLLRAGGKELGCSTSGRP